MGAIIVPDGMFGGAFRVHGVTASGGDAAETTAFLARTSGLDTTHTNAYKALINGLVTDGVFSKFDALYIFATLDATTSLLSLVSSTYNLTANSSPTFTADHGYQASGTSSYLDTGFNTSTATSPKYAQNSAHFSLWNNTNATNGNNNGNDSASVYIKYIDGNTYSRINDASGSAGYANSNPVGLVTGNRSSSTAIQAYQNASSLGSASQSSTTLANQNIRILQATGGVSDQTHQLAAASFGSSLSSTDVSNYYSRMQTYMTAVGN